MKSYFDVVIIAPLDEEFIRVRDHFKFEEDLSTETQVRFRVSLPTGDLRVLIVKQSMMGKTAAQAAVFSSTGDFDIGTIVCLGIAGSLSSDLNIGDVCYSRNIIDVLDNAKVTEGVNEGADVALSPTYYNSPVELITALSRNKLNPNFSTRYSDWQDFAELAGKDLIPAEFTGKGEKQEILGKPVAVEGVLVCGDVCASPTYIKKLKGIDRKVLAIETESGGIFSGAQVANVPALTVRGICDYAGTDKNKFEEETKGKARTVAADNATSFLLHQLQSQLILAWLMKRRSQQQSSSGQYSLLDEPVVDRIGNAISSQSEVFDEKLRELAPSYSLLVKGYHLPTPRLSLLDDKTGLAEQAWSEPSEIRDLIRNSRILLVSVPRDYPDHSISWIIAYDLLSAQIADKQIVPVVVEAKAIQRPKSGLKELVDAKILSLNGTSDAALLFLINDFNFESKTRSSFLKEQVEQFPEAYFIIVTSNLANVLTESSFSASTGASIARIDGISFVETAHFLQKKFELTAPASEVVASRLRDTFDKFDLPAHPSYFAGIPPDTLAALLDANRRGELIQIAVAGYLSYVVANDPDPVVLSRTTREHFLAELSYAIKVEKRTFSESALVRYVEEMKAKYDYAVSPVKFIGSFVEKGILHFDKDEVQFTLPFIESYLLAKKLYGMPERVMTYFALGEEDVDLPTFALYAELGASPEFIGNILASIASSIAELNSETVADNVLLGNGIMPVMLKRPERLAGIQRRLRKAVTDVREDQDQSSEKQKLIDAANRVRKKATKKSESEEEGDEKKETKWNALNRAFKVWIVAVNLVGSGVERIEALQKRELIKSIVELTALLIDRWTRAHQSVDFAVLKAELLKDEKNLETLAKSGSKADIADAKKVLESLVDLLEYVFLSEPFRRIMDTLCEEAREKVLAESLVKTSMIKEPNRLIHGLWLADIDAKRGREVILESVKNLPDSRFLCLSTVTHLMTRVFWKHWKKDDRLILLDMASDLLQPLDQHLAEGPALQRSIRKEKREPES